MQSLKGLSVESTVCLTPGMLGKQRLGCLPEGQQQPSRCQPGVFTKSSTFGLLLAIGGTDPFPVRWNPPQLGSCRRPRQQSQRCRGTAVLGRRGQKRLTKCGVFKVAAKNWKKNKNAALLGCFAAERKADMMSLEKAVAPCYVIIDLWY